MKAMVLAAGLGTRLGPLTNDRPKALVEINGRTLLEIILTRLRAVGVYEVIVNVHHFADMIAEYIRARQDFGMRRGDPVTFFGNADRHYFIFLLIDCIQYGSR